jgi:hypothetical protein
MFYIVDFFIYIFSFREANGKLLTELARVKYVALSFRVTDCWTLINNEGYMTVTVHYTSEKKNYFPCAEHNPGRGK